METNLVVWLQEHGAFLFWPIRFLSELGPSTTFNVGLALLFWCWSYSVMSRVWLVNFGTMYLTTVLKLSFHTPRPYWVEPEIKGLARASGFGMPSGHCLVATGVWGEVARQIGRRPITILCLLVVFGVGFSRLYLGVHSLAQILVGFALGAAYLMGYPKIEQRVLPWFNRLNLGRQIGVVFGVSIILGAIAVGVRLLLASYELPAEWVQMAGAKRPDDDVINPLSVHSAILSVATAFGFSAGYLILCNRGWNCEAVRWSHRGWRAFLGAAILGPYVYSTRKLLHGDVMTGLPFAGAISVDYIYGTVTGGLIALALPYLFYRLKI